MGDNAHWRWIPYRVVCGIVLVLFLFFFLQFKCCVFHMLCIFMRYLDMLLTCHNVPS